MTPTTRPDTAALADRLERIMAAPAWADTSYAEVPKETLDALLSALRAGERLREADVERLQFVQRVHREDGGPMWWEAVSTDNPAVRVQRPTFDGAIRALANKRAALADAESGQ